MKPYIINEKNVDSALQQLSTVGSYYVITNDITLPSDFNLAPGSVLDFRGGSFSAAQDVIMNLNSCPVFAAAYPIFKDGITVKNLVNDEVKAEWFKHDADTSDEQFINRALKMSNRCPVVLQNRTYTLKNSIKFVHNTSLQTLICPGTLQLADLTDKTTPAIEVNTQVVTLKINKIFGYQPAGSSELYGVGVRFNTYIEYSDIEVGTMSNLYRGFSMQPEASFEDIINPDGTPGAIPHYGAMQYSRIKFHSIAADYCFFIDLYSFGYAFDKTEADKAKQVKFLNWFNENVISGEKMEGKYGIYVVDKSEVDVLQGANPTSDDYAMNGLKFENISFEKITELPMRLRKMERCQFLNLQMFNSLPGNTGGTHDYNTTWVDMAYVSGIKMTFNSYIIPSHFKAGLNCSRIYIYGAVLDNPAHYSSHFDTLGFDTVTRQMVDGKNRGIPQMFVTNSVMPFNIAKNITSQKATETLYLNQLLPDLKDGNTQNDYNPISVPVLPSTLNVQVLAGHILTLDLTGIDSFAPCLYTVNANIASGGKLIFQGSNNLSIEDGKYQNGTTTKEVTATGTYAIQWLNTWQLRITKI